MEPAGEHGDGWWIADSGLKSAADPPNTPPNCAWIRSQGHFGDRIADRIR